MNDGPSSTGGRTRSAYFPRRHRRGNVFTRIQVRCRIGRSGQGPAGRPGRCGCRRSAAGILAARYQRLQALSSGQREKLVPIIKQTAVTWGLGVVEVEEIDQINILEASLLAMGKH